MIGRSRRFRISISAAVLRLLPRHSSLSSSRRDFSGVATAPGHGTLAPRFLFLKAFQETASEFTTRLAMPVVERLQFFRSLRGRELLWTLRRIEPAAACPRRSRQSKTSVAKECLGAVYWIPLRAGRKKATFVSVAHFGDVLGRVFCLFVGFRCVVKLWET